MKRITLRVAFCFIFPLISVLLIVLITGLSTVLAWPARDDDSGGHIHSNILKRVHHQLSSLRGYKAEPTNNEIYGNNHHYTLPAFLREQFYTQRNDALKSGAPDIALTHTDKHDEKILQPPTTLSLLSSLLTAHNFSRIYGWKSTFWPSALHSEIRIDMPASTPTTLDDSVTDIKRESVTSANANDFLLPPQKNSSGSGAAPRYPSQEPQAVVIHLPCTEFRNYAVHTIMAIARSPGLHTRNAAFEYFHRSNESSLRGVEQQQHRMNTRSNTKNSSYPKRAHGVAFRIKDCTLVGTELLFRTAPLSPASSAVRKYNALLRAQQAEKTHEEPIVDPDIGASEEDPFLHIHFHNVIMIGGGVSVRSHDDVQPVAHVWITMSEGTQINAAPPSPRTHPPPSEKNDEPAMASKKGDSNVHDPHHGVASVKNLLAALSRKRLEMLAGQGNNAVMHDEKGDAQRSKANGQEQHYVLLDNDGYKPQTTKQMEEQSQPTDGDRVSRRNTTIFGSLSHFSTHSPRASVSAWMPRTLLPLNSVMRGHAVTVIAPGGAYNILIDVIGTKPKSNQAEDGKVSSGEEEMPESSEGSSVEGRAGNQSDDIDRRLRALYDKLRVDS